MNHDLLSRWLQRKGFEISIAVDGQKGADKSSSGKADLILLDTNLQVTECQEATAILNFDFTMANIPVIALTAHAMQSYLEKALEADCNEYDTEPVNLEGYVKTSMNCLAPVERPGSIGDICYIKTRKEKNE